MRADVVIVGAGTAGAAAAMHAARRGLSIVCVDRRPLGEAGARWVNGVPAWMFDEAQIARPEGDELAGGDEPFHLIAPGGEARVVVRDHGLLDVDVRRLVARLQSLAAEAGATLLGDVQVKGYDGRALLTSIGPIAGTYVIDASGLSGAKLLAQPPLSRRDLCAAAQQVREVTDLAAARAWFDARGVREGETLCFAGVAGGYSVVNARLAGDRVSLLAGSIPADGQPAGHALLEHFATEHAWVGPLVFGGARAIPLRRPYDKLADDRVALLGDAACQVFAAHGSGTGIGMVAARVLAEELARGAGVSGYATRFMRSYGGLLAAWDQLRRLTQSLDAPSVTRLVVAGLVDAASTRDGLAQRWPTLDAAAVRGRLAGLAREPRLAARLSPYFARMAAAAALYARYPSDASGLASWSAAARRLLADGR